MAAAAADRDKGRRGPTKGAGEPTPRLHSERAKSHQFEKQSFESVKSSRVESAQKSATGEKALTAPKAKQSREAAGQFRVTCIWAHHHVVW